MSLLKKGEKIRLNNEDVVITEVWSGMGFYYRGVSEDEEAEQRFCNTMFFGRNFEPVFE